MASDLLRSIDILLLILELRFIFTQTQVWGFLSLMILAHQPFLQVKYCMNIAASWNDPGPVKIGTSSGSPTYCPSLSAGVIAGEWMLSHF